MTWEPRNKCDFDGDLSEDPQQPEGFQHHATGKTSIAVPIAYHCFFDKNFDNNNNNKPPVAVLCSSTPDDIHVNKARLTSNTNTTSSSYIYVYINIAIHEPKFQL